MGCPWIYKINTTGRQVTDHPKEETHTSELGSELTRALWTAENNWSLGNLLAVPIVNLFCRKTYMREKDWALLPRKTNKKEIKCFFSSSALHGHSLAYMHFLCGKEPHKKKSNKNPVIQQTLVRVLLWTAGSISLSPVCLERWAARSTLTELPDTIQGWLQPFP